MKKQNTLVSILIINYNNEKFVSRAVNSCLIQNYNNIEILIHDDKSKDMSINKINKFRNNKKVKIFTNKSQKKNIPSFDAMNGYLQLFNKSKGKIIRPSNIKIDKDFFNNRHSDEMKAAQKEKYSQNDELKRMLLLTKNAKLTHFSRGSPPIVFTETMELRQEFK